MRWLVPWVVVFGTLICCQDAYRKWVDHRDAANTYSCVNLEERQRGGPYTHAHCAYHESKSDLTSGSNLLSLFYAANYTNLFWM